MALPSPLPDNPNRWDGWKKYNADDPYQRLCLSFEDNPSSEQIEDHCRQLLVWWQKKLPLKSQPSNPLAQMLRGGLDEAPKYLAEARTLLLNADLRKQADDKIRARLKESAASEFYKFLAFALADGLLHKEDENNLYNLGATAGLSLEEMTVMVDAELTKRGAIRAVKTAPPPPPAPLGIAANDATFSPIANATAPPRLSPGAPSADPKVEFARMLRLTGLGEDDMTDDQRDALCNMGENLGLTGGQAEDVIDEYLEEVSGLPLAPSVISNSSRGGVAVAPKPTQPKIAISKSAGAVSAKNETAKMVEEVVGKKFVETFSPLNRDKERQQFPNFKNIIGQEMLLVTSGSFLQGSATPDAGPQESPAARTNISCFFLSRFSVTNAQFEMFDPSHRARRAPWADDDHPVVYVSSIEAMKFCEWLSSRERKKYRLPTESEWEYAARGTDGRTFPWGEKLNRGDLANFADANTNFAWRDAAINDGFSETSPVGSYPRGASPFGIEDMAGNVWEWCLDFFEPYKGKERTNPRSLSSASGRRIYRGGSWKSRATSLRAATRNFNVPQYSANDVGFRIVCECEG